MDLQLAGKRAVVTGGSMGIGRAVARQLALEGVHVVVAARHGETLQAAVSALQAETGAKVLGLTADTRDDDSVAELVAQTVAALGGLDILVNAAAKPAGQSAPPKLADVTEAQLWEEVDTKVMGYIRTARYAAPIMVQAGWGRIINVSGLAARQTGSIIGSIRNIAVAAMTKNLADELGPKGVNVTVVHPGLTRTERTPAVLASLAAAGATSVEAVQARFDRANLLGRMIDASEVADVVAFLASPRSVAVNGDAVACGGGAAGSIYY